MKTKRQTIAFPTPESRLIAEWMKKGATVTAFSDANEGWGWTGRIHGDSDEAIVLERDGQFFIIYKRVIECFREEVNECTLTN